MWVYPKFGLVFNKYLPLRIKIFINNTNYHQKKNDIPSNRLEKKEIKYHNLSKEKREQ